MILRRSAATTNWAPSLPVSKPLRISGPAGRDLAAIAEYTQREWGAAQKRKYLAYIKKCFALLRNTPAVGTPRDDIAPGLLSHPVEKHIVFYRESEQALLVVRVLHGSMDVKRHLIDTDDK